MSQRETWYYCLWSISDDGCKHSVQSLASSWIQAPEWRDTVNGDVLRIPTSTSPSFKSKFLVANRSADCVEVEMSSLFFSRIAAHGPRDQLEACCKWHSRTTWGRKQYDRTLRPEPKTAPARGDGDGRTGEVTDLLQDDHRRYKKSRDRCRLWSLAYISL
jgi:hypothetical protein